MGNNMDQQVDFKASLDKLCTVITIATTLLIVYLCFDVATRIDRLSTVAIITLALILPLTYLYCLLMMPLSYSVTENHIRVRRILFDWEIRLDLVKIVRMLERDEMKFTIRLFGVGGLFGYFGIFRNSSLGNFKMLGTRRNKALLIETVAGKKVVITPDEPEKLITYLNSITKA